MNYVIEVLTKEKEIFEDILSKWDLHHYPESRKVRDKKLKELNEAIEKLKL